jgi:hypothetical protein
MSVEGSANYEPTPEEIKAACLEIQATWTPQERDSRLRGNACATKFDAPGVEHDARGAIAAKLAKHRETMRQA